MCERVPACAYVCMCEYVCVCVCTQEKSMNTCYNTISFGVLLIENPFLFSSVLNLNSSMFLHIQFLSLSTAVSIRLF